MLTVQLLAVSSEWDNDAIVVWYIMSEINNSVHGFSAYAALLAPIAISVANRPFPPTIFALTRYYKHDLYLTHH